MADPSQVTLPCPLCDEEHRYPLVVERSVTLGLMRPREPAPEISRQFVRTFVCPTKGDHFQATLRLSETAYTRIKNLTVRDPVEGSE
jgi:hypothetical protein